MNYCFLMNHKKAMHFISIKCSVVNALHIEQFFIALVLLLLKIVGLKSSSPVLYTQRGTKKNVNVFS